MGFIIASVIGTILFVILYTIGGLSLKGESYKLDNYRETTCMVRSSSIRMHRCAKRTAKYPCYAALWNVTHGIYFNISAEISDTKKFDEIFKAQQRTMKYHIGANYSCWYNPRMPFIAQWNKPNKTKAIVLLSVGGFVTAVTIVFIVLATIFTRQERKRMKYSSINP